MAKKKKKNRLKKFLKGAALAGAAALGAKALMGNKGIDTGLTKGKFLMAKLCPKGKAAAKRKFKVYPSAYANMYASGVCSGKITPGGKKKRKKLNMGGIVVEDVTRMVDV